MTRESYLKVIATQTQIQRLFQKKVGANIKLSEMLTEIAKLL